MIHFSSLSRTRAYLLAILCSGATIALRLYCSQWFDNRLVLVMFVIPILLSAYWGGLGPGILSTAITTLSALYLFIPPRHTLVISRQVDLVQWLILVLVGIIISWLAERLLQFRRQTVQMLSEHRQAVSRFRQIAETLPQLVWTTLPDGQPDYFSPQWLAYTGVPEQEQIGNGWIAQVHPDDRERVLARWQESVTHPDKDYLVEYRIRRHDGIYRWFDTRAVAFRDENGNVVKWFGSSTDIEDRRQSEIRVHESEERFRTVVESAPDAIFIQTKGCFAYVNSAAIKLFGARDESQLLGTPVLSRFHPDDRHAIQSRIQTLNSSRTAVPQRCEKLLRCDDTTIDVEVSAVPFTYRGESGALVFARDITERRRAEEQLLLQGTALESAANAIAISDTRGTILWINPAFTLLTGYTREEMTGKNIRICRSGAHNEAFYSTIWSQILSGRVWHGEMLSKTKNGKIFTQEMTATPVTNNKGEITHLIAVFQDVTARKQVEEEHKKLEQQLFRSQKLDALGRLSGGIAHDFNNILTAISGHLRLVLETLPGDASERQSLLEIDKASRRAGDLVRRILAFSRNDQSEHQPLSLETIVTEAVNLLRAMVPAMVEIRTQFKPGLPSVIADPIQIHQIIMNLGSNATHAMGDKGGLLEFSLSEIIIDAEQAKLFSDLSVGRFVLLTVSDHGCGMDKNTIEKIFDPFFTTKNVGEGTGLGLSVVHGIMKSYNGTINVYSQPGQGTAFRLYFPATEKTDAPKNAAKPSRVARGNGEHVLYVDDEKMLVTVSTKIIQRLGYTATGFTSPDEALDAFRAEPDKFRAIISDYSMPGMNGFDLVRKIHELRPDCPAVLASGYFRPQDKETAQQLGIKHLISKPNTIDELDDVLHSVFNEDSVSATPH
jgi:PAS domain S-box-containing protein